MICKVNLIIYFSLINQNHKNASDKIMHLSLEKENEKKKWKLCHLEQSFQINGRNMKLFSALSLEGG